MGTNQTENTPATEPSAAKVGKTRDLLQAVMEGAGAAVEYTRLHDEVHRINPGKEHDPSELIELSVKMSPRGFEQRRYGAAMTWQPSERGRLAEHAGHAAPTEALRAAMAVSEERAGEGESSPQSAAARDREARLTELSYLVGRSTRFFTALAYDFDRRRYKLYQFKHRPVHYFESLDLVAHAKDLPALSYIRTAEVDMDDPSVFTQPVYFKLRFVKEPVDPTKAETTDQSLPKPLQPADVLSPDYSPHSLFTPRLLSATPDREQVVQHLRTLLGETAIGNDPVVKFVPPSVIAADGTTRNVTSEDFRSLDYGVNLNLRDPVRTCFVEDYRAAILGVAEALGCLPQAKAWLQQIRPFDCFVSYLGIGADSVSLYYRSTNLHRGRPSTRFIRKPK